MKDLSPIIHGLIALAMQVLCFLLLGSWVAGACFGSAYFIGREVAQAEYRYIQYYGYGKRHNLRWFDVFRVKVWSYDAILDFIIPCVAVWAVVLVAWSG